MTDIWPDEFDSGISNYPVGVQMGIIDAKILTVYRLQNYTIVIHVDNCGAGKKDGCKCLSESYTQNIEYPKMKNIRAWKLSINFESNTFGKQFFELPYRQQM